MGNDVRKWIPNQKDAKWPHKHHNMSIKLIHKSTRIQVLVFKKMCQFCWSNAAVRKKSRKTLWKSEFVFLLDHYLQLPLLYIDLDDLSVMYFSSFPVFFNFFISYQLKLTISIYFFHTFRVFFFFILYLDMFYKCYWMIFDKKLFVMMSLSIIQLHKQKISKV